MLGGEAAPRAERQAEGAFAGELDVDLDFIGHHVEAEVTLVVIGLLEAFRCHVGQTEQAAARVLAAGDVERVEQVEASQVVLEQRVRPAVGARAFGEHLWPALAEQQGHPAVERNVLFEQAYQANPEVRRIQRLDQLPDGAVPGDVLQGETHLLPLLG